MNSVFCTFGVPKSIRSVVGPEFANSTMKWLCDHLQIDHTFSIPHHHQSNGLVERCNKEVLSLLQKLLVDYRKYDSWSTLLPQIQLLLNTPKCSVTNEKHHNLIFATKRLSLKTLSQKNIKLHGHDGPFKISKALGSNSYEITHLGTGRTYQPSAYRLHPCLSTHSKQLLEHVAAGEVEECVPEEVLDHEKRDRRLIFLIQWSDG
ncbi:hypothetical protein RCL1_009094 [Eukaryota sp. TZLM3-RCL]